MTRYVNPAHPAGPLYPQDIGALKGAGGYAQSRSDMTVLVRVAASFRAMRPTPISERKLMNVGGAFGTSINAGRMVNDEGDVVRE